MVRPASGGLVSLLCVFLAVAMVVYVRRPVVEPTEADLVNAGSLADWSESIRRDGHVDIGLRGAKLAKTFVGIGIVLAVSILLILGLAGPVGIVLGIVMLVMIGLLALLPHLDFATGGRPAIKVDTRGIEIARSGPTEHPLGPRRGDRCPSQLRNPVQRHRECHSRHLRPMCGEEARANANR